MNAPQSRPPAFVFLALLWLLSAVGSCTRARTEDRSEPVRVAVASNFAPTLQALARRFESRSGYRVEISSGSTGKLYAQIENGAPFHVFLAADAERPALLEARSLAVQGTRFTYAVGRLALYGPGLLHPQDGAVDLTSSARGYLSMANPETAPYGRAARQTLQKLQQWDRLEPRIVRGENVAQAQGFVDAGSAELGFVALAGVMTKAKYRHWTVPEALHDPIRQDAVLLSRGAEVPAARELLEYLKSDEARRAIEQAGYATEGP